MKKKTLSSIALLGLFLILAVSCTNDNTPEVPSTSNTTINTQIDGPTFPNTKVRDVPSPAPIPWKDVEAYTEQTYEIEVNLGDEFAIAMYATIPPSTFWEHYDQEFIELVEKQMVYYVPGDDTQDATEWFLFKAVKAGATEMVFQYPLEYTKLFRITIS